MRLTSHHLELPDRMRAKLEAYRRRVWTVKLAEGLLAAVFGLLASYLLIFALDRFWDTPAWLRGAVLVSAALGFWIYLPLKWHRWVWRTRQLTQAARLLRRRFPRIGDQLLGIVELVQNEYEQDRSESLCRAAMRQVDEEIQSCEFDDAVPNPRHRRWAWVVGVTTTLTLAGVIAVPLAGSNALMRWLMPWRTTQRYTFAQLSGLPERMVVPYAEPFRLKTTLAEQTAWSPGHATARYDIQRPVRADLRGGGYMFSLPPQKESGSLAVTAGDTSVRVRIDPTPRPELISIVGRIDLPDYLNYPTPMTKDVRSGSISMLKGSKLSIEALATRELAEAFMNGRPLDVRADQFVVDAMGVDESTVCWFTWRDQLGLKAKDPFGVSVKVMDDESPSISCGKLRREQIFLSSDLLTFEALAQDDYGVKSIGVEWVGIRDPVRNPKPDKGEKLIAIGGPETRELNASASFSSEAEGIRPQSLELRLYAIDYVPGRERVYSPVFVLHILSPEEHAIWLTGQLNRWFRQSQEVYEREQQLLEQNKALRALPTAALDFPENRRRIEAQVAAEQGNARRLGALTKTGAQLIQQAVRNDQFNVATLENWSQMIQTLEQIANDRMPSVVDLLKSAAIAPGIRSDGSPGGANPSSTMSEPGIGQIRDSRSGGEGAGQEPEPNTVPPVTDIESGYNDLDDGGSESDPSQSQSGAGGFTLPGTAVLGGGAKQEAGEPAQSPVREKLDEAVEEHEDLLAEFAKVAEELKKILGDLEGSTFVKRLKAASRHQMTVANELNQILTDSFGLSEYGMEEGLRRQAGEIGAREVSQGDSVYVIQEDLEAYYNRVRQGKFKTVLHEMRSTNVVSNLQSIAAEIKANFNGQSIAQAEFWGDTLDRWAEQLIGPG